MCSAYPLASLGHAAWILRHFSYRAVFIWGLCLYGIGALICIPCVINRSFAGFCVGIFVIGNGLGSLETAANPYITGKTGSSPTALFIAVHITVHIGRRAAVRMPRF